MAVSTTGCLALAGVIGGGPLIWGVKQFLARWRRGEGSDASEVVREAVKDGDAGGREQTDSVSYLFTLLGYAIGLGNVWRFPYLVGKWGGGAFVLAYLVCLFLIAMPLYLMEMSMGHYTRKSTLDCFRTIHPKWVGLGIAQCVLIFCTLTNYNVLVAYCAVYVANALRAQLPWSPEATFGAVATGAGEGHAGTSAAELFWTHDVLNKYEGSLEGLGLGAMQWHLVVALAVVWVIVFLSLAFGKKVLAQVTWVTVVGPVFLMAFMVTQALQLEGAGDGIAFYIGKFELSKLYDIRLWATACSQILFSLSPGFGTAITMSSFTDPKANVFKTCMVVSFCNSAFSITGGLATFGILGNLALRTGTTVAEVASASGTGLAFIALADGMRTFGSMANAMAVLFFIMLMALGLDSTFAWAETLVSILEDTLHSKLDRRVPKNQIVGACCLVLFVFGLPFCTRMGNALVDVVDHYVGTVFLLFACLIEIIMFNMHYKFERLALHLRSRDLRAAPGPCCLLEVLLHDRCSPGLCPAVRPHHLRGPHDALRGLPAAAAGAGLDLPGRLHACGMQHSVPPGGDHPAAPGCSQKGREGRLGGQLGSVFGAMCIGEGPRAFLRPLREGLEEVPGAL